LFAALLLCAPAGVLSGEYLPACSATHRSNTRACRSEIAPKLTLVCVFCVCG
jgi:hypothetical protein